VWTFIVKDAQLKLDNGDLIPVERARIVACKMADSASK
jgi:transcription initiation factor TFIIA small subunit